MSTLSYRETRENGLSFELAVDGTPIKGLGDAGDAGIPYWLVVGEDLPRIGPEGGDRRIVAVCSCGEYGCGHTSCRVEHLGDQVRFSAFEGNAARAPYSFVIPADDFRVVVAAMASRADAYRNRERF